MVLISDIRVPGKFAEALHLYDDALQVRESGPTSAMPLRACYEKPDTGIADPYWPCAYGACCTAIEGCYAARITRPRRDVLTCSAAVVLGSKHVLLVANTNSAMPLRGTDMQCCSTGVGARTSG